VNDDAALTVAYAFAAVSALAAIGTVALHFWRCHLARVQRRAQVPVEPPPWVEAVICSAVRRGREIGYECGYRDGYDDARSGREPRKRLMMDQGHLGGRE
jgi:hypothetical protein